MQLTNAGIESWGGGLCIWADQSLNALTMLGQMHAACLGSSHSARRMRLGWHPSQVLSD
jgi:hypothetical protein